MMNYNPLRQFMTAHGLTWYDLQATGLPHSTCYAIRRGDAVSLGTLNFLMYSLHLDRLDQVVQFVREGTETENQYEESMPTVNQQFDHLFTRQLHHDTEFTQPKQQKKLSQKLNSKGDYTA